VAICFSKIWQIFSRKKENFAKEYSIKKLIQEICWNFTPKKGEKF
jgi:hypothetical protein